jgi:phage gp36-like protein
MAYVVWSEVVARYADIAKTYDSIDAQTGFINGAEAELDSRLAVRYTVPFSPVPPIIKDLAIDMAYYRATWRQDSEGALKDFIERRLAALVAGSASLVVSGSVLTTNQSQAWSDRDGIRSVFGPDDATNWSVSEEWQQSAQEEREGD